MSDTMRVPTPERKPDVLDRLAFEIAGATIGPNVKAVMAEAADEIRWLREAAQTDQIGNLRRQVDLLQRQVHTLCRAFGRGVN